MSHDTYQMEIQQGATFRLPLQWLANNVPVDLTGCAVRMQVRERAGADAVLLELSTSNGGALITDAANGRFELVMTDEATAALTWPRGAYDVLIIHADGSVTRILQGGVTVSPGITLP